MRWLGNVQGMNEAVSLAGNIDDVTHSVRAVPECLPEGCNMRSQAAFVDDGSLYAEYGVAVQPHLERVGASLAFAGNVDGLLIGGEHEWDAVAVIRYPSRSAFLEMVTDAGYQEIAHLRTRALRDSRLIPTDAWDGF